MAMQSFKQGILFGLSIITRRGIIFPQYKGRGLQKFFPGANPRTPIFTLLKILLNQAQLLIGCIETGFREFVVFNTFFEEWGTIKDNIYI